MLQKFRKAGIAVAAVTVASGLVTGFVATTGHNITNAAVPMEMVVRSEAVDPSSALRVTNNELRESAQLVAEGQKLVAADAAATKPAKPAQVINAEVKIEPQPEVAVDRDTQSTSRSRTRTSTEDSSTRQRSSDNSKPRAEEEPAPVPASGRGAGIVAFAKAQLGKPYGWGATGPNAYDCSGLTMAAYRSVGVSIPRTSQSQFGAGQRVAKSDLQPGDLVFYRGLAHVGIYVGGGKIIHATHPGAPVRYQSLNNTMSYDGAVRP